MFIAYELSLELIDSLADLLDRIRKHDADLARQLRRAGSGVPLQIAEGNRRTGKDRLQFFRIASGSADEVRACLHVALRWRYLDAEAAARAMSLCDRLLAILWRLTERTSPRSSAQSRRASARAATSSAASDSLSPSAASSAAATSAAEPSATS
jgi:four helix bundle protein